MTSSCRAVTIAVGLGFASASMHLAAQQIDPARFAALRWRSIGPFRGGRTVAAAEIGRAHV